MLTGLTAGLKKGMRLTLVTGSTGAVGNAPVRVLRAEGRDVRHLVRNKDKAVAILPTGVDLAAGDVNNSESLTVALRDCSAMFHAAGMPEFSALAPTPRRASGVLPRARCCRKWKESKSATMRPNNSEAFTLSLGP